MNNSKSITMVLRREEDYFDYKLEGFIPESLYVLSLIVTDYFLPSFSFDDNEKSHLNSFVTIVKQDGKVIITAKEKYQRKVDDNFVMTLNDFITMIKKLKDKQDAESGVIRFILKEDGSVAVTSSM
jgi:hypothetical protein